MIIDADSHIYEPRGMWKEYTTKSESEHALTIEDDDLGYSWFKLHGKDFNRAAWVAGPTGGDFSEIGRFFKGHEQGIPNPTMHLDDTPATFRDMKARLAALDGWGIDKQVLFNQWGFQWEPDLMDNLVATTANMAAYNRWAAEVAADGEGRLLLVGHITLAAGPIWLEEQLKTLAAAGIRMAMFTPLLVDGKRLSHPDHDVMWALFTKYNIAPTWHISNANRRVIDNFEGWAENDNRGLVKLVPHLFTRLSPEISLVDMAVNGVFERHPDLQVVVAEFGAEWLPSLMRRVDGSWKVYGQLAGEPYSDLPRPPSEYMRDHALLVCSFPSDVNAEMLNNFSDQLAYGGDFPHPEGLADPLHEYRRRQGGISRPDVEAKFFGEAFAKRLGI